MPSPRDLDPKFKDENPNAKNDDVPASNDNNRNEPKNDPANPGAAHPVSEGNTEVRETSAPDANDDDSTIVYRERVQNPDGSVGEKVHGPMARREWAKYEKEHNL